jgi:DNA mismatch repair protein MutS
MGGPRTEPAAETASSSPGSDRSDSAAFTSLLSPARPRALPGADTTGHEFASDLNLDQIVEAIAADREQRELIEGVLYRQVKDVGTLVHRHEIFRDLEDQGLLEAVVKFSEQMRQVRSQLAQLARMYSARQQEGWLLDASATYCRAVTELAADLGTRPIRSRGLLAFRRYLDGYTASPGFSGLATDAADRKRDLAGVTYMTRIRGPRVEVSRYEGEPDYSAEIEEVFARFEQAEANDYRIQYRTWPGMTHVGAQILDLVARLFPGEFAALREFCQRHAGFVDAVVDQFDRELQFYLAYLDYIRPIQAAGLVFCYPDLTTHSKEIFASETFDLALAAKLSASHSTVVTNNFHLTDAERIIVVSGPNQGGKTTFARTFGQLHHLASTGCPVPGSAARLYVFDQILTHFEREEDIATETGKLEDDLLRIQRALLSATPQSIVIMNEIFASTTLSDATFLGEKVLAKVIDLDLLCVYVTFVDELASRGGTVVSMASTVVPTNPAERTYKVIRKPSDGLAYALAIAARHRVTYQQLHERLSS